MVNASVPAVLSDTSTGVQILTPSPRADRAVGTTRVILESRVRRLRCVQLKAAGDALYYAGIAVYWIDVIRGEPIAESQVLLVGLESCDTVVLTMPCS